MKYLKMYESFDVSFSENDIHEICKTYNIINYTINSDGSIDVNGEVDLYGMGLTKLPLKFRNVTGNFYCYNNKLTNLEGCPQSVGSNFYCSYNQLTNLEGCPQSVGSNFDCSYNQLTNLEGCPQSVGSNFDCRNNPIYNIYKLFDDPSKIELFNDYDCIRIEEGKPAIIIDRLNDFLEEIGESRVKKVKGFINI
jgi:hypothetical protein